MINTKASFRGLLLTSKRVFMGVKMGEDKNIIKAKQKKKNQH